MNLSDLIDKLQERLDGWGDLPVYVGNRDAYLGQGGENPALFWPVLDVTTTDTDDNSETDAPVRGFVIWY